MLQRSGAVGRPAEWLWGEEMERNRAAWGTTTWADYLNRVLEAGTGETGAFARSHTLMDGGCSGERVIVCA